MSIFTKVNMRKPKYSTFDLSHQRKFSCNMGQLVPMCIMETVPGDKFNITTAQLVRFAPMVAPMMHEVSVYTHFFFVPNRILWPNWEDFITGGEQGTSEPEFPKIFIPTGVNTLADYLGIPDAGTSLEVSALPFAAYNKIYNDYYRDQNLLSQAAIPNDTVVDGNQPSFVVDLQTRAWQHDYFTSALPWTQKGPEATIPLGTEAPIFYDFDSQLGAGFIPTTVVDDTSTVVGAGNVVAQATGQFSVPSASVKPLAVNNALALRADLSQATAATINELRNAFRLQEWLEKNARGGSRYTESILSHFGVNTGDARLQRPEFLGGGSTPISISEVLQTSSTDATTPQANMAGHGISAGQTKGISYRCKEHGYIMGIISIMPKTAYQQGVPRHWKKFDKFDYYWPEFAHLGEQPIFNEELYADGSVDDDGIFGYTPRYAEYKYVPDTVHGEFRTTLDFWHMGRKFATRPALNMAFIECDPTTRIFANESGEQCYIHMAHSVKASRPMPYFGTPKF